MNGKLEEGMGVMKPPPESQRHMGMHWLEVRDVDGNRFGLIALQWNPGSQTWTHSNAHDTFNGRGLDVSHYRYVKPIPLPDIEE